MPFGTYNVHFEISHMIILEFPEIPYLTPGSRDKFSDVTNFFMHIFLIKIPLGLKRQLRHPIMYQAVIEDLEVTGNLIMIQVETCWRQNAVLVEFDSDHLSHLRHNFWTGVIQTICSDMLCQIDKQWTSQKLGSAGFFILRVGPIGPTPGQKRVKSKTG